MIPTPGEGVITTLYSFKGGVGRTMAGANVGFTAAMSGLRVLIMDWDLEAPGMAYYFRGLGEPEQSRAIKDAPGVMDLVWAWRKHVGEADGNDDVEALLDDYASGAPFEACVRPVLGPDRLPAGGQLDILGAGSKQIDEDHSYALALARFSWADFFDESFGGFFIERLRAWAKSRYDIILVDSRTGYADVAGVCTVQLPDVVALAFIYNRQNIEGVANVAGSIQTQREGAVRLRAIPMRLSREGTLDEAEARGRAIRHFTRNKAFTEEAIKSDLDRLAVRAAAGLPFYETLAAFEVSSTAELLAIDYKKLAENLFDRPFPTPVVDEAWRNAVARRLEPKMADIDYVRGLETADAIRAADEVDRLLDGALESELHDDRLDREYVETLIWAGLELGDTFFDEIPFDELTSIADKAISLARSEFEMAPRAWAEFYVKVLTAYDANYPSDEPDEWSRRLWRYDGILEQGEETLSALLRRAQIRRELAAVQRHSDPDRSLAWIQEGLDLLERATDPAGRTEVLLESASLQMVRARLKLATGDSLEAFDISVRALESLKAVPQAERPRIGRITSEIHLILARSAPDKEVAADEVLKASEQPAHLNAIYSEFAWATATLLESDQAPERALDFTARLMAASPQRALQSPAFFFSRALSQASTFIKSITQLLEVLSTLETDAARVARESLVRMAVSCLDLIRRRPPPGASREREMFRLLAETSGLLQTAADLDVPQSSLADLARLISTLDARSSRSGEIP